MLDIELTAQNILELSSSDALTAMFARMGYNTNARITQTPANLGITAEGTIKPIRSVELLADQEGLFQVYLFELTTVTITHTRALARAFRNRAGNYLLILTSDYERIDFVFLEKYLPHKANLATPSQKQVGIRPRVLTVNRHDPSRVDLRVLRRLTNTEQDPFAQYDKIVSAYSIKDWSEDFFNNRALFSDYYLLERLRGFPEWSEDPKPTFLALRDLHRNAPANYGGRSKETVCRSLLEPSLELLGFTFENIRSRAKRDGEADYRLWCNESSGDDIHALCLAYPWGRSLDAKDYQRDSETSDENPGALVVSLLEKGEAPWAIVTNGKVWRLYAQRTHSRATNYYEIDLEEVLAETGPKATDPSESFRYFWLMFRSQAFVPEQVVREGKEQSLCFLDRLLLESEDYAKKLGERLKSRVFEQVFPRLAEGFIHHIRQTDGSDTDLNQARLDTIFQGTLTLLYRLLFLLYSESRGLLPINEDRGYYKVSLTKLKKDLSDALGNIADGVDTALDKQYGRTDYTIYDHLCELFMVIDQGDAGLNVPLYNGGLFLSAPEDDDNTPEADSARFLNTHRVPDRFMAKALDLLARDIDERRQDLVSIDFKSLGVRQLGSIYEGLLEFKLRVAPEKMAIVKGKRTDEIITYKEAKAKKRKILREGRSQSSPERTFAKGVVYLENDKRERKATGSYYTPDHIVKYIVKHTVGPVLDEKFDAMRPKLREAQAKYRAFFKKQDELKRRGLRSEPESKANLIGREIVDELFDIKVLDPAMGSGHFLVEAVDIITDKTLSFLNSFPWNPVQAHLEEMRESILQEMDEQGISIDRNRLTDVNLLKRHVLKRCIYGVDLNPMAVELAKVSLWLDCFTLGAPLSFLDHHLRYGNSLIGSTIEEADTLRAETGQLTISSTSDWQGLLNAVQGMIEVGHLPDVTSKQVARSRQEYGFAISNLEVFKKILDLHVGRWFVEIEGREGKKAKKAIDFLFDQIITDGDLFTWAHGKPSAMFDSTYKKAVDLALVAAQAHRFFHWELEFPEVFYGLRPGTQRVVERLEDGGFDAVVGNPPYDVLSSKELGRDISNELAFFEVSPLFKPAIVGKKNYYKLFISLGVTAMNMKSRFSFIVPMALLGDAQSSGVRHVLLDETGLQRIEAFPQKDDPKKRVFPEAKLSTTVFVVKRACDDERFILRVHPENQVVEDSHPLIIRPSELREYDPENRAIPSCVQDDWDIIHKIIRNENIKRLKDYIRAWQGEVNETTDGRMGYISKNSSAGPQILRGSTICQYVLREPSQGEAIFLRKNKYLKGRKRSARIAHQKERRVGWQESSPQNNFRRIIAAPIPPSNFCNHKINYIPESDSKLNLDLILAILNSKLSEWYFRIGSSNAAVSHYQIYKLPAPTICESPRPERWDVLLRNREWEECKTWLIDNLNEIGVLPLFAAESLAAMSVHIQEIEKAREIGARSERSQLTKEAQAVQEIIDSILFNCFGLSETESEHVSCRLSEML